MAEDKDLILLPFVVVECSSGNGTTLHDSSEEGDGWQSERGCQKDTQMLVLKVQHEDDKRMVHALEIICHESKVPEKVEISLGSSDEGIVSDSFDQCKSILHLGYITLADPEKSGFQARELKSVPIDKSADFVQLVLQGCHENPHNVHNQVGIVGIRVLGMASGECDALKDDTLAISSDRSPPRTGETSANVPIKKIVIGRMDRAAVTPMSSLPSMPSLSSASLPSHVKHQLDPKMQISVERLERLKKERAALEDFEMAGKIKDALGNMYALLIAFKDCESQMREAATAEDYVSASRLKTQRNLKREAALQALQEVEGKFIGNRSIDDEGVGNLSISTIKNESFMSQRSARSSRGFAESAPIEKKIHSSIVSPPENRESSDEESHSDGSLDDHDDEHPLEGVENAEELPTPEEINDNGVASLDFVQKVQELFGSYRTKCFFSKNWMLREAALAKMTLLIPEVCSTSNLEVMCKIIEVGIDDKNVQVYLASIILLDESMVQIESVELPQTRSSSLSKIATNLLGKLSDSKQKVVESSTLSLLSMASSSCIDNTSIVNAATKRIRSKDSKGGRAVKARLCFLENLAAEFGDGVAWKRIIEFIKCQKAFEHKDGGVRDAAKSLVVTLMAVHGEDIILQSLQDCEQVSERQLNEFRSRFAGHLN
mmetsp:Transcript_9562/g.20172  ORF Transcript_9562/g.20172 Transcript_9562/m.20172 type:complete len:660 (+) Transcript_9562:182-2161(+)